MLAQVLGSKRAPAHRERLAETLAVAQPPNSIGECVRIVRRHREPSSRGLGEPRGLPGSRDDHGPAHRAVVVQLRRHEVLERRLGRQLYKQRIGRAQDPHRLIGRYQPSKLDATRG